MNTASIAAYEVEVGDTIINHDIFKVIASTFNAGKYTFTLQAAGTSNETKWTVRRSASVRVVNA